MLEVDAGAARVMSFIVPNFQEQRDTLQAPTELVRQGVIVLQAGHAQARTVHHRWNEFRIAA